MEHFSCWARLTPCVVSPLEPLPPLELPDEWRDFNLQAWGAGGDCPYHAWINGIEFCLGSSMHNC